MAGLPPQPPARPNAPVPPSGNQSKGVWIGVGVTLALAILALLGLSAAGILRFGAEAKDSGALAKQGSVPNRNLLSAEGQTSPPVLEQDATREVPLTMPADIYEWLRHLEETEKRKVDLSFRGLAQVSILGKELSLFGGAPNPLTLDDEEMAPPQEAPRLESESIRADWNELLRFFESRKPPEECLLIANDYYRALSETAAMSADLGSQLSAINGSGDRQAAGEALTKVLKMLGTSDEAIDKFYIQAERGLDEICRKYNTSKWFNIRSDVANGMLGTLGL